MDLVDSGTLTNAEFEFAVFSNQDFKALLDLMDIGVGDIQMVFEILDKDGNGIVDYEEFVEQLHYMGMVKERTVVVFI